MTRRNTHDDVLGDPANKHPCNTAPSLFDIIEQLPSRPQRQPGGAAKQAQDLLQPSSDPVVQVTVSEVLKRLAAEELTGTAKRIDEDT